ncbi:MFS transporter [Anaeromyxobacter sp. PSR-1]|uniref:MFS transporter n=1 Tax=Anaeromyxobacter sp. PSR-1 TaxID=1300915 RepID=UPI0005E52A4E|nr:MFS transporter [Anaeromyxobacter sp. PSR-1]GAO01422.1 major Facilitator Superfamily protein [Anaeromyxobacter sp. PSR-1]
MATTARQILRTYVVLTLLSTFASSFIWGINTLFLLDAGLSVAQAFAANAFFTVGEVLFEVPTGVVADTMGRRVSYLLGAATLFFGTLLYLAMWRVHGPFWGWAGASILLGLGFTFFSGATEAWLVDGLSATHYQGTVDAALARGKMAEGAGMLVGTILGGVVAQATNLGVPYALRAAALALTFAIALASMHDVGFTPRRGASVVAEVRGVLRASLHHGLGHRPVRWVMLGGLLGGGVPIFGFYAMQPYLLQLRGEGGSYAVAGLAAALVALAQISGAYVVPWASRRLRRRTTILLFTTGASAACLAGIGLFPRFWVVLALLAGWAIVFAMAIPIRQAYLNSLIPSAERATVLSFDNLLTSAGGAIAQPALGKIADVWSYPISYVAGAAVELAVVPFLVLARRERAPSDRIDAREVTPAPRAGPAARGAARPDRTAPARRARGAPRGPRPRG